MRDIKFRGFHECENGNAVITVNGKEKRGEWVYGYLFVSQISGVYIIGSITEAKQTRDGVVMRDKLWEHQVDPSTVGQYTGLKDMRGDEIYEGDIIKSGKKKLVVFWNSIGSGGWWYAELRNGIRKHVDIIHLNNIEVIGNIHDNPELMQS